MSVACVGNWDAICMQADRGCFRYIGLNTLASASEWVIHSIPVCARVSSHQPIFPSSQPGSTSDLRPHLSHIRVDDSEG